MSGVLILASSSASRQRLLKAAGVVFRAVAPAIDEDKERKALVARKASHRQIAEALAQLKAERVSTQFTDTLVLGADQLLVCAGAVYDKATDKEAARRVLRALRGREHELITAVALIERGAPVWRHVASAKLCMRDFSDAFLEAYIASEGEALFGAVGCYCIEGRGAQLFSEIEGDYFGIQGLPLFAVLEELRRRGVIEK